MTRKAVGYVRVSTLDQAENGVSLDAQREKIEAMARVRDADLGDVIVDAAESAKDLDRPGVQRLLDLVRRRGVDEVIVSRLDRLTRSVRDLAEIVDTFNRCNVSLVSVAEFVDTGSANGRMVLNLLTTVSQWEREVIAERTRDALRHKRGRGEKLGGKPPYGYTVTTLDNGEKRLHKVDAEQSVIVAVRAWRELGWSMDRIAAELNARGTRTRDGGEWKRQYIHRILNRM